MEKNDFGKSKEGPYGCFGFTGPNWMNTVGWLTFFGTGKVSFSRPQVNFLT